jgi:hypothetical protein
LIAACGGERPLSGETASANRTIKHQKNRLREFPAGGFFVALFPVL